MARASRHYIPGHIRHTPVKYAPPQLNSLQIQRGKHSTGQAFNGVNNTPMSQERVLTQILKGSASVGSVALPSQEALWPNDFELYSHLQPHSPVPRGAGFR